METTCGSLLSELQKIWHELGESESEKDKMLLELELECLEVYRRKVDQASQCRAHMRKAVADHEAELAYIYSAMVEQPFHTIQRSGNLKEKLDAIMPQVEEMRRRKYERRAQFVEVLEQIKDLSIEICTSMEDYTCMPVLDERDLSLRRLEELQTRLLALQKEKSDRIKKMLNDLNTLKTLCTVLGVDFKQTINEIHPSLDDSTATKDASTKTMEMLHIAIQRLQEIKIQRLQQLQDFATSMVELWSLMDTPIEEQLKFQNITKNITVSGNEVTEPSALSADVIHYAEVEVSRLQQLKSSKLKEVILKRRSDLEDMCRKTHVIAETQGAADSSIEAIEFGIMDPSSVLEHIELQISKVKEEAFSRKDVLEKVEKWLAACDEEHWLEEYNRDDNRYSAGKGTHLILKRAEKARAVVNKIPGMVEALTSKVKAWEEERGAEFLYDGVCLLSMLEKYTNIKQEKQHERQRQRDQKKLQGQLLAKQEALFGSKPSPLKSGKKIPRTPSGGASSRRFSVGGGMLQASVLEKTALPSLLHRNTDPVKQQSSQNHHQNPVSEELSYGKKTQDIGDLQVKQLTRKPLSPVNSALLSRTSTAHNPNQTIKENYISQTHPTNRTPGASPAKTLPTADDRNRTPRAIMSIPLPATPSTVSIAMQRATTPATPFAAPQGLEYSFEERRACSFSSILPESYP
ncbi:hypothetical protein NMG60_11029139 [Bertholletia excelsa]